MKPQELTDKYYRGETSLEEEKELKQFMIENNNHSSENEMFTYYKEEGFVPDDLEETLSAKFDKQLGKGKRTKLKLLQIISAAAVILVILTVYINMRNTRNEQLENTFFTMENALYRVAESIQPDVQEDMLVLWVDDNVEIIIH